MIFAGLVLMVAIFALIVSFIRSKPLSGWGLVALTSLVLLMVFSGISNALYFSVQLEHASSPRPDERTPGTDGTPRPPERVEKDARSEEHTSELQSRQYLVCRLLLEKKKHDSM